MEVPLRRTFDNDYRERASEWEVSNIHFHVRMDSAINKSCLGIYLLYNYTNEQNNISQNLGSWEKEKLFPWKVCVGVKLYR